MTGRFFRVCAMVMLLSITLTGCETVKKISQVIKNPDIPVGKITEQPSEVTVTLLTEPDTNTNADGEAEAVDVQLVYLSDDSKLQAADYDQIASTPLPDVLGKNYIDHQDFNLLPDTIKTLPPVKLDEKTQFIGVVAYFSDDQATEWKQIEPVDGVGHNYRLLVHVRQGSIEMKKEDN
nr:type VI secretion system lipoprotein TssJ [Escherichia fergusonii]